MAKKEQELQKINDLWYKAIEIEASNLIGEMMNKTRGANYPGTVPVTNMPDPKTKKYQIYKYYDILYFLMSNSPGAPQCINKLVSSIFHTLPYVRPIESKKNSVKAQNIAIVWERFLRQPDNLYMLEYLYRSYLGYGNGFIQVIYNDKNKKKISIDPSMTDFKVGDIIQFKPLFPENLEAYVNKDLLENNGIYRVDKWKYNPYVNNGRLPTYSWTSNRVVELDPAEVIHYKRTSLLDPIYGTAVLEEGTSEVQLGIKILNFNLRFFKNSAKPPLWVKLPDTSTREQAENFKFYFDQHYGGDENAWKTAVGFAGAELKELTMPSSASFLDLMDHVLRQVHGMFEVPLTVTGITKESNRANAETDFKEFIRTKVNPEKIIFSNFLTSEILNKRADEYSVEIYFPEMHEVSTKQTIEQGAKAVASGLLSINDIRRTLNAPRINEPWADELLFASADNMFKVSSLLDSNISGQTPEQSKVMVNDAIGNTDAKNNNTESNNANAEDIQSGAIPDHANAGQDTTENK